MSHLNCLQCESDNMTESVANFNGDEIQIVECADCYNFFVFPEDYREKTHNKTQPNCVDTLKNIEVVIGNDEFPLKNCPACGFYTRRYPPREV